MDFLRKLQIPLVRDNRVNEILLAETINSVFELHELQALRQNSSDNHFTCFKCGQRVHLHSVSDNKYENGHRYHFQHPSGIQCEWRYDNKTKAEIYSGIKEGKLHQQMKFLLKSTLNELKDWEVIDVDKYFIFSSDRLKRRKPDLHARYKGIDVVFEIQLRSEKPETISARKEFYREKGYKLVWVSAENRDIVSDSYADDCIEIKQVQKDIAFTNRWNWFVFNEELKETSLKAGELTLQAVMWSPSKEGREIYYQWEDELAPFSNIQFEDGEAFLKDLPLYHAQLSDTLRREGKKAIKQLLKGKKAYREWDEFLNASKEKWPTLEAGGEDGEWLHDQFKLDRATRELALKKLIIEFFQSTAWRDFNNTDRWIKIAYSVREYDFGINTENNLYVIDKLLLILGYSLSDELHPKKRSFVRACHFFYDDQYEQFRCYRHLCNQAIEKSIHSDEILTDKTMRNRLDNAKPITQPNTNLDKFFFWFFSGEQPVLEWSKPQQQTQRSLI